MYKTPLCFFLHRLSDIMRVRLISTPALPAGKKTKKTQKETQKKAQKKAKKKRLRIYRIRFIICPVEAGLWLQADASRRQNGPRNPSKAVGSMVRLRSKPGRVKSARERRGGRECYEQSSRRRVWGQRPGQPIFKPEIILRHGGLENNVSGQDAGVP